MPDFNSDRELGKGKLKWVVRNAHKGLPIKTINTGKGELKLDKKGRCVIADAALAAEVRKDYPHDLAVSRIFSDDPADRGHHFFWGGLPGLPWHKYDENGLRILEEEESNAQRAAPAEAEEGAPGAEQDYNGEGIA